MSQGDDLGSYLDIDRKNQPTDEIPYQNDGRTDRSQVEPCEIDVDLFNRLLKTGVIRASPQIKTIHERNCVILDQLNSQRHLNGMIFAQYLVILKQVMSKVNQDFAIDENLANHIKEQGTPQARLFNWNFLCNELDKIGIIVENDTKSLYVAGDHEEIGKLFERIERYIKRISGDQNVLSFDNFRKDDRKNSAITGTSQMEGGSQIQGRRGLQTTQRRPIKDGVDIMSMDIGKDPSQTESTLEFILNTLCRALTMKPKQAAALLTNNNQFLIHCVVKGVKGRYEPMVNWYNDIYQNSRHLSNMLETEVNNALAEKDPKHVKASQQNFDKVLQTISTGCYSQNLEVAQLCMKTLTCISQDFSGSIEMVQLSLRWYLSKDNGLYTVNYAFKKHPELNNDFVQSIGTFANSAEQMRDIYMNDINILYPDMVEYFNCVNSLLPFITLNYAKEMQQSTNNPADSLLSQMIEKAIKFTELNMQNIPQVRIAAISLLTEIWLSQSSFIEKQNFHTQNLQLIYQRSSRDKQRSIRIVACTHMFTLLDKFAQDKNQSAPVIYKALIFSLVESPHDQTIRELYLTNFQYLYEQQKSIPVGLLIEPLVKANQVNDAFLFQTFDYDFYGFMAQHPKLTVAHSIQMLDLLARQYLNDICNASAVSVPFIMICARFINTLQCQEFVMKFITISLSQLLQISSAKEGIDNKSTPGSVKGKQLALPAPSGTDSRLRNQKNSQTRGPSKDFRINTSKKTSSKGNAVNQQKSSEEDINDKLKKQQIITMLLKIQNLRQDDVNNAMRDMLLGAQKQYKDQNFGYLNNGIMAVLKYWGDPDLLFNQYLKRQEKIESEERKAYERLLRQEQIERRMLGYESDEKNRNDNYGTLGASNSRKGLGLGPKNGTGRNSMGLMPIAETQQNLRALHELEMIKKYKKDKELEEKKKFTKEQALKVRKDQRLKEELDRRKVAVGVPANHSGIRQELKALIYKEDGTEPKQKRKIPVNPIITLIDLRQEEDRDQEIINQFMKKYAKIWKYLFSRYANQMYSSKGKKDFDDLGLRREQINLPEAIKMLKDHDTYPQLVSKDEMQQIFRLINLTTSGIDATTITMIDYQQFLTFIPQLALYIFSRPPIDQSQFPPVQSLQSLIDTFEKATRDRGKSTVIYEDPDASPFVDRQLLEALDFKVNQDPSYPVPEGFRKICEKVPVYQYRVPDSIREYAPESKIVVTELLDEILFKALGQHFLEPLVSFEENWKVKPAIKKRQTPAPALGYMSKIERKTDKNQLRSYANPGKPKPVEKRRQDLEIIPKLNLALKMEVTKIDLVNRPRFQEVAEVLEEMLQAVDAGETELPPRPHRKPGQLLNEVKANREAEQNYMMELQLHKDMKRMQRDENLKQKLKDTNFGGRQMPIEDYKKIKDKVEREEYERLAKKERDKFQAKQKQEREKVAQLKSQQLEELQKQKGEQIRNQEQRRAAEENIRKEFLAKQKQKISKNFQDTYKQRDTVILKKKDQETIQKSTEDKLKKQMNKYIATTKDERGQEKQERQEIVQFLDRPDVKQVFDTYHKQLSHMFKFYAAQDSNKDKLSYDSEWLMNTLNYKELVRFSYQQDITPNLIAPDDMVYIYKTLVRETQDTFNVINDQDNQRKQSGFIDYESFKKAIVRISVRSQEKLGGGNQDFLQDKLKADKLNKQKTLAQRKTFKGKQQTAAQKEQERIDALREQFNQEQQYKENELSKATEAKKYLDVVEQNDKNATLTRKQRKELQNFQLDQAKLQKEEEFFSKWLQQRENLGLAGDNDASPALQSSRTVRAADLKMLQKKDMTSKELKDLDSQLKEQQRLKNIKFEKVQVRSKMDVSSITAGTIEEFLKYLDLNTDENERDLNRRLTQTNAAGRKATVRGNEKLNETSNLNDRDSLNNTNFAGR